MNKNDNNKKSEISVTLSASPATATSSSSSSSFDTTLDPESLVDLGWQTNHQGSVPTSSAEDVKKLASRLGVTFHKKMKLFDPQQSSSIKKKKEQQQEEGEDNDEQEEEEEENKKGKKKQAEEDTCEDEQDDDEGSKFFYGISSSSVGERSDFFGANSLSTSQSEMMLQAKKRMEKEPSISTDMDVQMWWRTQESFYSVVRDGRCQQVLGSELVVGDCLILSKADLPEMHIEGSPERKEYFEKKIRQHKKEKEKKRKDQEKVKEKKKKEEEKSEKKKKSNITTATAASSSSTSTAPANKTHLLTGNEDEDEDEDDNDEDLDDYPSFCLLMLLFYLEMFLSARPN